jgi:hypothetical protein
MEVIAQELYASWINGNLTDVIDCIAGQGTKKKAALLAVLVYACFTSHIDKRAFIRMLGKEL